MSSVSLSKADSKVLAQVFDPESGPASAEVIVDPSLPADRYTSDTTLLFDLRAREKRAIQQIETYEKSAKKTTQAKEAAYRTAVAVLDQLIEEYPNYASARNNRAQLRRWRLGDRNLICQQLSLRKANHQAAGPEVVQDLKQSICLALPERSNDAVSPAQGKLLAQAHTQLGAVYLAAAKDVEMPDTQILVDALAGWTKGMFEQEASRMFYLGGLYGNEVAKALAVHTNPHAKLCGNIVKEAMRKEFAQAAS